MRISDWSSDVCSSDLSSRRSDDRLISTTEPAAAPAAPATANTQVSAGPTRCVRKRQPCQRFANRLGSVKIAPADRTSVVQGKNVSVRVDLGGRRILNKNNRSQYFHSTILPPTINSIA